MKTERHNVAGRMKALSKSPLGAGLVNTDIGLLHHFGSDNRLAQHNLQVSAHELKRIIPPYLFSHYDDTRPGQQLKTAQWQHADLCRNISGKTFTLHTALLGVGGTCYTEHTLYQFKHPGLDHQRTIKLARKLHVHPVMCANKLLNTRCAIGNNNTYHGQLCGRGDSRPFRANVTPFPELV
eukprot:1141966-Pelagomonas_calceolata.AAC.1